MKKYMTPCLELQHISTTDIMTGSVENIAKEFLGFSDGGYMGDQLDFRNF